MSLRSREEQREYTRKWRKENPDRAKEINRRATEVSRVTGRGLSHTEKYINKYPEKYLYRVAKSRAMKKSLEFSVSLEDIIIPEICPVFLTPMVRHTRYAPSLDRIDCTKGYTPDNIQVISKLANTMKNNATEEELQKFAKWILDV